MIAFWLQKTAASKGCSIPTKPTTPRVVDELFLATLPREPSPNEKQVALAAIGKNRVQGAQNLQWALINQVEFFFNH